MNFDDFINNLKAFPLSKVVFVGLGNEYRGNDAAGLVFFNRLKTKEPLKDSHFIYAGTNPENYLTEILLQEPSAVIFIDSVHDKDNSGSIKWIGDEQIDTLQISTHAFSIKLIGEYFKSYMPMEVRVLGISVNSNNFMQKISDNIMDSINKFFENI